MNFNKRLKLQIVTPIIAIIICVSSGNTGELSSARGLAMSGAMTALAGGIDAAKYNPANLGLSGNSALQVELLSFGINVSNNSFTLDDYNKYTGATLSASDKTYLLGQVPKEGLNLKADAEAAAMSIGLGKFAFSVSAVGAADANLNKDIIELLLNGNSFADSVVVTGSYSDGIAYAQAGLSYGKLLYESGSRQLSVGGTIKYLRGIGVEEIIKLEGLAATQITGFQGSGEIASRTATGGSGYGLDIGAALKINRVYTIGARLENFLGTINWNKNAKEQSTVFSFDTLTINNANDSVIVSTDSSKDISSFSTRLPIVMNLGVAKTSGKLRWGIDWEQGFKRTAESSTKPRLAIGLEWLQLSVLPVRLGYASGGGYGGSFSFGSGIHLGPAYVDMAAVTGAGISVYSAKGLKLALSTGVRF